jgi:ubiquinone/menaquinone biosynthesis C-methylase UbiE
LGSATLLDWLSSNEEYAMSTVIENPADAAGEIQAAWSRIARGYDEFVTPTHEWLGGEGLRRAGLRAGMRFLDVAAGSGALSLPAARLGARVLATDLSPVMLHALEARARKESLTIETRAMDGHALDLADATFDIVGSQFGVMLFPDMPRGIREMARVTKPGGRVLMNVYGDPRRIEFFVLFVAAIRSVVPSFEGPPTDPPPLPFQLQDPKRLGREFAATGLGEVTVETVTEKLEFASGGEMWNWLLNSNPIVSAVLAGLGLTEGQIGAVVQALEREIRTRVGGGTSAILTNPINIGVGTKR